MWVICVVPIQEIKEANGLTSDTIYAGKKLVILLPNDDFC